MYVLPKPFACRIGRSLNGDVRAERALHVSVSAIFRLAFHV